MRILLTILYAVGLTASAGAQDLKRPATWRIRPDQAGADTSQLYFVGMPPGWHVTTGPAAILWDPANSAAGGFRIDAEIFFFREGSRDTEGYGVVFGGSRLDGPDQSYLYFLLRNDGKFAVKHRTGAVTHTITDWTGHSAIVRHTGAGATVKNTMAVAAEPDSVRLFVNGQQAGVYSRSHMKPEGLVGLRVNHFLNLHVAKLEVGSISPPAAPRAAPNPPSTRRTAAAASPGTSPQTTPPLPAHQTGNTR